VIYGQLLDFETDDEDDKINAVLSSTDPSLAKEILNGKITWEGTKPNRPEDSKKSYTIERTGNDYLGVRSNDPLSASLLQARLLELNQKIEVKIVEEL